MESSLEIWKTSFDENYEVSNFGRIRSLPRIVRSGLGNGTRAIEGKILKPFISKRTKYFQVSLTNGARKSLHRLVAFAFCDGFFDGAVVNHKNGNRQDNKSSNLEWVTQKQNNIHSFAVLKRKPTSLGKFGAEHPASKPIKMVCKKTGFTEVFDSGMSAKRVYPWIDSGAVSKCCAGKSKSHKGYLFSFENSHD
jgi:NUMOD4 motif/HNH endonuclease